MKLAALALAVLGVLFSAEPGNDNWLSWTAARAEGVARAAYVRGRVGGFFDTRILKTEGAYNYKLAATWMHGDVIRATARVIQLNERLSDDETMAMVVAAEAAGDTVVMVEIDPREGSGIIPNDWAAFLQPVMPSGTTGTPIRGASVPALREVRALGGVMRRNYDYDRFWVVFPLTHSSGEPVMPAQASHVELVVRISGKEGRVRWPRP